MSRKHNTKHDQRSGSRYKLRLEARGLSKAPQMPTVESLRKRQERRPAPTIQETIDAAEDIATEHAVRETGSPEW